MIYQTVPQCIAAIQIEQHSPFDFLSWLANREDSLLSCASDFLPITIFVSIRTIN